MAGACMAASGTTSQVFTDDATADKNSTINSEMLKFSQMLKNGSNSSLQCK